MNDDISPRRLGHRLDKVLVEHALFFWTHVIVGLLSGAVCVCAELISIGGMSVGWGRGSLIAFMFLGAVLPFVVSCARNIDRQAASATHAVVFVVVLSGIAILVNIAVAWILITRYSLFLLFLLYLGQIIGYVFLGDFLLEPSPNNDELDW